MKRTENCQGAPTHSRKCIIETIRTLELDKHLLEENLMVIDGYVQQKFAFCIKKTHMKRTENCQGTPTHSRKCILETIRTLELDKHLLEENLIIIG
jgi:hypothetical protein